MGAHTPHFQQQSCYTCESQRIVALMSNTLCADRVRPDGCVSRHDGSIAMSQGIPLFASQAAERITMERRTGAPELQFSGSAVTQPLPQSGLVSPELG